MVTGQIYTTQLELAYVVKAKATPKMASIKGNKTIFERYIFIANMKTIMTVMAEFGVFPTLKQESRQYCTLLTKVSDYYNDDNEDCTAVSKEEFRKLLDQLVIQLKPGQKVEHKASSGIYRVMSSGILSQFAGSYRLSLIPIFTLMYAEQIKTQLDVNEDNVLIGGNYFHEYPKRDRGGVSANGVVFTSVEELKKGTKNNKKKAGAKKEIKAKHMTAFNQCGVRTPTEGANVNALFQMDTIASVLFKSLFKGQYIDNSREGEAEDWIESFNKDQQLQLFTLQKPKSDSSARTSSSKTNNGTKKTGQFNIDKDYCLNHMKDIVDALDDNPGDSATGADTDTTKRKIEHAFYSFATRLGVTSSIDCSPNSSYEAFSKKIKEKKPVGFSEYDQLLFALGNIAEESDKKLNLITKLPRNKQKEFDTMLASAWGKDPATSTGTVNDALKYFDTSTPSILLLSVKDSDTMKQIINAYRPTSSSDSDGSDNESEKSVNNDRPEWLSALTNLLRDENGYGWTHNLETRFGCNDPDVNERIDNVCKEKKMRYISFMDSSTDEKVFIHPKRQTTGKNDDGMSKEEKFALRLLGQKSKKTDNNEANNNSTNKRKQGDDDDLHDACNNDTKKRKTGGSGDDSDSDSL